MFLLLLDSEKEFHILPHRVFVPVPGSTVMLCDYKFGDESAEEIRAHFIEMLDHMIQIEDLEIAEEINTGNYMMLFKNLIRLLLRLPMRHLV